MRRLCKRRVVTDSFSTKQRLHAYKCQPVLELPLLPHGMPVLQSTVCMMPFLCSHQLPTLASEWQGQTLALPLLLHGMSVLQSTVCMMPVLCPRQFPSLASEWVWM